MNDHPMAMSGGEQVDRMTTVNGQDAERMMELGVAPRQRRADRVVRDDAMTHDVDAVDRGPLVDRRMARLRGGRGRNGERNQSRSQNDPQPRRKLSVHGLPPPLFVAARLTPAVVSILSGRGRANPR